MKCLATISKVDICALIVSVCALGLAYYQAIQLERSNQVSVLPILDVVLIGGSGVGQPVGFKIDNAGKGPAVIESLSLFIDGKKVKGDSNELWWNTLIELGMSGARIVEFSYAYLPNGVTLREGRELYLMGSIATSNGNFGTFRPGEYDLLRRISVRIEYRGLFGNSCYLLFRPANLAEPYDRIYCMDD
jgi:hypothetical protein